MSIPYTRQECQANRTTNEVINSKNSSKNRAGFESQERRTVDRTVLGASEVEPTEVGHKTKATSVNDASVKNLKFSQVKSHSSSAAFLPSVDYSSSSVHAHAARSRTSLQNTCSLSSEPDNANLESSTVTHSSMADSQRTMFTANIPQIPKLVQSEQLTQSCNRITSTEFPSTSVACPGNSLGFSSSVLPNSSTILTDSSNTSDLALYKQAASKHTSGLCVKGQPGMEMQRNASQATYSQRVYHSDTQKNSGDTRDIQSTEQFYAESSLRMDNASRCSRRRQRKDGNVGSETSEKNANYMQQRLPAFKHHTSQVCGVSSSYAESGSEESLPSSSYESDVSPSADISRSSKRRKRVKRKNSTKSIGSSMYGEDNTSDGESVNETQSEFSDSCSKNLNESCSKKFSANVSNNRKDGTQKQPEGFNAKQLSSNSITMLRTRKIMSTSLTSVSSFEGNASAVGRKNSTGSRCPSPGGTVAKVSKIQIQSFSATLPNRKRGKENRSLNRRSDDENSGNKTKPEKSLSNEELSYINQLTRTSPTDKSHLSKSPFGLKYKPFQLHKAKNKSPFTSDHEQSRTQSPTGSDRSSGENNTAALQMPLDAVTMAETDCKIGDVFDRGTEPKTPSHPSENMFSSLPIARSVDYPHFTSEPVRDLENNSPKPSYLSRAEVGPGCCASDDNLVTGEPQRDSVPSTAGDADNRTRPLSTVTEQDEYVESTAKDKGQKEKRDITETDFPDISNLRRPSYVFAQRISEERLVSDLMQDTDEDHFSTNHSVSPSPSKLNWENTSTFENSYTSEHEEGLNFNLTGTVTAPLGYQEDVTSSVKIEQPVENKEKQITLSRPQIPTILSLDDDNDDNDRSEFDEGRVIEHKVMQVRENTHEGQESGDDIFMESSTSYETTEHGEMKASEVEMPDFKSAKVTPTSIIQCQRRRSLPISITSEPIDIEKCRQNYTKQHSFETDQYMNERNLQKQTISHDYDEELALRKSSTFDDLSISEHEGVIYDDEAEESQYFGNKDVVPCDSSTSDSHSNSQLHLDAYSVTSSGFSEQGQVSMPELHQVGGYLTAPENVSNGKASDAWRSHSDPSGQSNGSTQLISEAVADAELKVYRNSNSEPNLNSGKLKNEAAMLARRMNSGSQPERGYPYSKEIQQEAQPKYDSAVEISPDEFYEDDEPYPKPSRKSKSAPSTPTQPRKQKYSTLSAEKAQLKLSKLAAMEPILETPQTAAVGDKLTNKPIDRKWALQTETPLEDKRPSAAGYQELKPTKSKHHDVRRHVLQNLLDTETSYVLNLQYLVTNYYKELKKPENAAIVDPAQVEEMFYQIPDILLCHEFFLEQLQIRANDWHDKQKIGDIFVASFTKSFLMDAYSAFIGHFLQARAAVRSATLSRPLFARFIEQSLREKLTLQDLMIMPVQRIPRYVLILKDMIKHTPHDHPDHGNLQLALGEIKQLADRMNKGEKEDDQAEREAERLREIEASIENMADLVTPGRRSIRQDLVAEVRGTITKKDRCLFLFNDLLICATVKRRANALRRGSLSLFSGQSGTEFNKYKLLWQLPLEYVEIIKSSPDSGRRNSLEKQLERLDNDMSVLSQISSLADTLDIQHQVLDTSIRDLMNEVSRQIQDKNVPVPTHSSTKLELQAQTEEGPDTFIFLFLETEIKNSWEAYFDDAKQKLAYAKDKFPPEFMSAIPITKTRSGMQFTCASPSHVPHTVDRGNHCGTGDVWVCNSDGYVGQVCILSMVGPIQPMASLSVSASRILCVSPVPGSKLIGLDSSHTEINNNKQATRTLSVASNNSYSLSNKNVPGSGYISDEDMTSAQTIMAFDSSSDDEEGLGADSFVNESSPMFDGRLSPEGSSLGTAGSLDGDAVSSQDEGDENDEEDENLSDFQENDSSDDEEKSIGKGGRKQHMKRKISTSLGSAISRSSEGFTLKGSLTDLLGFDSSEGSTLWLGTEDGSIYVYPVKESPVQARKNKMKIQHHTAVLCILYVDNQVFVSLANGELCCYRRQPGSPWEVATPVKVNLEQSLAPVNCMTAIHGRLWCGCHCNVVVLDTSTLAVETSFSSSLDRDRAVYRMASSGMGVWLSLQSSAVVKLFHATSFENLADIDVGPPVLKMLQGSDAIIRQHKAACLRITALLTCKDLLWIGTSAGVVLTLPLPNISANTTSLRSCPSATASVHGHTGHVRFLTAVDVSEKSNKENSSEKDKNGKKKPSGVGPKTNVVHEIIIISGGDGYEDFKTSSSCETAGRDDSTNHLLTWRV